MKIAFYKHNRGGFAGILDRIIRTVTRGPYSHCELVFVHDGMIDQMAYSASIQDSGCRFKTIVFDSSRWDFIPVQLTLEQQLAVLALCEEENGSGYDFLGVFRFLIPSIKESPDKWFCSEICAAALQRAGLLRGEKPWQLHPNKLAQLLAQTSQPNREDHPNA
jgi:hypothetical protein